MNGRLDGRSKKCDTRVRAIVPDSMLSVRGLGRPWQTRAALIYIYYANPITGERSVSQLEWIAIAL